MFVMPFCEASTSSNSSTTSLNHEGVAEAKFRSRRLAIHITVIIVTGGSLGALGHGDRCARVGRREGSVARQARGERPSRGLASRP